MAALPLLLCLGLQSLLVQAMSLTLEHSFGSGDFSAIGHLESPPRELRVRRSPYCHANVMLLVSSLTQEPLCRKDPHI